MRLSPTCSNARRTARDGPIERLLDSLLYEGYALYPYTPGATKNGITATPFGIVYPPAAGAATRPSDLLRMECVVEAVGDAVLRGGPAPSGRR